MLDRLDEILQLFVELRLDIINIVYLLHYLLDLDEVLLVCSRLGGQDGEVFVLVLASWSQVSEEGDLIVDSDDIAVDGLVIEDGVILYFLEEVAGLKGELSEEQRVTLLGVGDETKNEVFYSHLSERVIVQAKVFILCGSDVQDLALFEPNLGCCDLFLLYLDEIDPVEVLV